MYIDRFGIPLGINKMGERIKALREEKNISQEELADKVGVFVEDIKLWEESTLRNMPPSNKVVHIAHVLDTDYYHILEGIDEGCVKYFYGDDILKKIIRRMIIDNKFSLRTLEEDFSINYKSCGVVTKYLIKNQFLSTNGDVLINKERFKEIFGEDLNTEND